MTPNLNMQGVVDLGALAQAKQQQTAVDAGVASWVVQVRDVPAVQDLLTRSMKHPVLLELSSAKANAQASSDLLVALTNKAAGAWLLGQVDVDQSPEVAAALQVSSVPTVVAFLRGQVAPLWQGTADEQHMAAVLTEVLHAAAEAGMTGPADPVATTAEGGPDPRFKEADARLEAQDYEGARAAFEAVLEQFPGDPEALAGRAQAGLLVRLAGVDPEAALTTADADGSTLEQQLVAADVELTVGRVEEAFARLVRAVRENVGADRDAARTRLLELFDAVGATEPEVLKARRDLAAALF